MSDDEFGDSSFLDSFDMEGVLAQQPQQPSTLTANSNTLLEAAAAADTKRRKISDSPVHKELSPFQQSLQATLQKYFGYSQFRAGQLEVLQQLMQHKNDVAVFWATGQGKSLCYQIPALHADDKTVIVVSPLVSLMQDQVHKLNSLMMSCATSSKTADIATFLGSAQTDTSVEHRLHEYKLVYVTPEKLLSTGFVQRLAEMADRIALVAIDEGECGSLLGRL